MLKTKPSGPSTMYSGTPCDLCGGPTLAFPSGSIWCPDEDRHPGGHFVVRVAFERSPLKTASLRGEAIKPRVTIKPRETPATVQKPSTPKPAFGGGGYDDFVGSDE
jgi:hypothetical protein